MLCDLIGAAQQSLGGRRALCATAEAEQLSWTHPTSNALLVCRTLRLSNKKRVCRQKAHL